MKLQLIAVICLILAQNVPKSEAVQLFCNYRNTQQVDFNTWWTYCDVYIFSISLSGSRLNYDSIYRGYNDPTASAFTIYSNSSNMTLFPSNLATYLPNLVDIEINMKYLTVLTKEDFTPFTGLLQLIVTNTLIEFIPQNLFTSTIYLQKLYFSNTLYIQHIDLYTFDNLRSLRFLSITSNVCTNAVGYADTASGVVLFKKLINLGVCQSAKYLPTTTTTTTTLAPTTTTQNPLLATVTAQNSQISNLTSQLSTCNNLTQTQTSAISTLTQQNQNQQSSIQSLTADNQNKSTMISQLSQLNQTHTSTISTLTQQVQNLAQSNQNQNTTINDLTSQNQVLTQENQNQGNTIQNLTADNESKSTTITQLIQQNQNQSDLINYLTQDDESKALTIIQLTDQLQSCIANNTKLNQNVTDIWNSSKTLYSNVGQQSAGILQSYAGCEADYVALQGVYNNLSQQFANITTVLTQQNQIISEELRVCGTDKLEVSSERDALNSQLTQVIAKLNDLVGI